MSGAIPLLPLLGLCGLFWDEMYLYFFTVPLAKEETVLQDKVARLIEIGRCSGVEMSV